MNNKFHKKMLLFFSTFLVLTILNPITFGQTKKELNKKIDNIEGKVERISIQTDKGIVNFTGKEAEEILKKLKKKEHKFAFSFNDHSFFDDDYNMVFFSDDDNSFFDDDDCIFEVNFGKTGFKKSVEVKEVDGKKEVTIKTTKDGKTTIKTLKGKEAEEYLDKKDKHLKHFSWFKKGGKKIQIKLKNFKVSLKDEMKKYFRHHKNDIGVEKTIDIKIKDGVKEVTVITTNDGKKTVNVYKGKEAEEYLENLDNDDDINIDIDDKDSVTKIIIIKKEKKTKKDK